MHTLSFPDLPDTNMVSLTNKLKQKELPDRLLPEFTGRLTLIPMKLYNQIQDYSINIQIINVM